MDVRWVRLIGGSRRPLPEGPPGLLDDLASLREHRGEKIAAVAPDTGALMGVLGLRPERDEGGVCFRLVCLEVLPRWRGMDVEAGLLEQAGAYMRSHRSTRLKLGTSPLLTTNAELFITRFGARYRWTEGARSSAGLPWPYVSCELDFDSALARPLDLSDEEIPARSVLEWVAGVPRRRPGIVWSGAHTLLLPDIDQDRLAAASERGDPLVGILHDAFHELAHHGYGFTWFDRLPPSAGSPGGARWYYLMGRVLRF
jgi:hypothetical protein